MFTKFKNFCEKPITYGAYFKICGAVLGLYGAGILSYLGYVKYQDYQDRKAYEGTGMTMKQIYQKNSKLARAVIKKARKEGE